MSQQDEMRSYKHDLQDIPRKPIISVKFNELKMNIEHDSDSDFDLQPAYK